ncbi:MAG: ADP-dependent NAD(P)H-hydrate dehydratase / NAD(P)H-hydrate epimerase [Pseudomonadota bacterium]|nr:ADP-dependent NAD(P)H-hydrate dehydratase / NAD(P)H-hydrate epimerase [Pseudomonadota bacterium]
MTIALPVSPPLFMASDIRSVEQQWAISHPGILLMEKAGAASAELAGSLASESGEPVLVLAGPGNNGGDALVAARLLSAQGFRVDVVSRADLAYRPQDAARAWAAWRESGGTILEEIPPSQRYSLVIDGLFGVGLQREITDGDARWIEQANRMNCPKLALDMPSGIDSDSGRIRGCALRADHTLTFLGLKPGLLTADGPDYAGQLHLDTLGVDQAALPATQGFALTQLEPRHCLLPRAKNSHKGLYGHIGIIGGAPGMVGAALIAGRAALRQGAGMVTLGVLDERIAVDYAEPRLMFAAPEKLAEMKLSVLALGPGLGQSARADALLQAALAAPCPLVLDADALNLLASDPRLASQSGRRDHPTLLTPHPGEAARLLGVSIAEIQADRIGAARKLGMNHSAEIALKGAGTIIAHPDGRYAINTSGSPWLAQAGSGDRLTGMVAALIGQGMAADDALESAVWLHGSPA